MSPKMKFSVTVAQLTCSISLKHCKFCNEWVPDLKKHRKNDCSMLEIKTVDGITKYLCRFCSQLCRSVKYAGWHQPNCYCRICLRTVYSKIDEHVYVCVCVIDELDPSKCNICKGEGKVVIPRCPPDFHKSGRSTREQVGQVTGCCQGLQARRRLVLVVEKQI